MEPERREEYGKLCEAVHARLVHSYLSACILWEILEFMPRVADKLLPDERDLLLTLASNAADRVVVTVMALMDTDPKSLAFGALMGFLRANCKSQPALNAALRQRKSRKRRKDLLDQAGEARNTLIAHFDRIEVLGLGDQDVRLLIRDVLTLQDEAQAIFEGLRADPTAGYAPVAAIHRRMLHLLAHGFEEALDVVAKNEIRDTLAPGTTLPEAPWRFGYKPPKPD